MTEKPRFADDYLPESRERIQRTCLYLATILGDLLEDIVVVGGLVPSLLIPEDGTGDIEPHAGTEDLDLGLALGLLDDQRYSEISKRLRGAGFGPDTNDEGNETTHRWKYEKGDVTVTLDFLMPPVDEDIRGGTLKNLEGDFAAIVTPGLHLAFADCIAVELDGTTINDEKASRKIQVCGPGAFIVLKALAFRNRGENKDAYDLYYVTRHYGEDLTDVAKSLEPYVDDVQTKKALGILRNDFLEPEALGPRRVADFMYRGPNADLQAEVVAWIKDLLAELNTF